MKKILADATINATTLKHVKDAIVTLFEKTTSETESKKLGYIAGIINSDGPDKVEENRRILDQYTERVRAENDFPVFSATDIFDNNSLWERLEETRLERPQQALVFIQFWRETLEEGKVTDIFMTPRWEKSVGARDEHETAKKLGIKIHYL